MLEDNFWQDKLKSQKIIKEKKLFEDLINSHQNSVGQINDLDDLYQLALEENNLEIQNEVIQNISNLRTVAKQNEIKWSDNKNFKYQIVSEHRGDEAGIKSTTLKIDGDYVFGWLKNESGIHRLVRISPFDSGARRHTSFASVWVYPVVDENINIEILEKDLRIDTYRSSGAGGQHVNTTDSAVRITHLPSKIVVQCQNERSQHKNKETCINMLRARLYDFEMKKKEQQNQNNEATKSEIGWGHQIRSYVLQPYRLVKDNRTNHESTSPDKVLDGEIDEFLEKSLYQIK